MEHLEKTYSGKVRDLYAIGDKYLLVVASDRLSAFDVVFPCLLYTSPSPRD